MKNSARVTAGICVLFLLALLCGCGGNASPRTQVTPPATATPTPTPPPTPTPAPTPTPTPTPPPPPPGGSSASGEYIYVSAVFSDNIWGYRFDTTSGMLNPVPGSPFSPSSNTTAHMLCGMGCGATFRWLTGDPIGKFLFQDAVSAGGGALFSFTVDPATGTLSQNDAIAGFTGNQQKIDPQGRFLVRDMQAADQTTRMNVIAIDRSNGHLSQAPGSPYTIPTSGSSGTSSYGPAVSATQIYDDLDERNGSNSSIYGFNIGSNFTLTSTPGSPYNSGNLSSFIAVHPSGKWVYAFSMTFVNTVGVAQAQEYVVNADGSLTKAGNPVVTNNTGGGFMLFAPNGNFAVVADAASPPSNPPSPSTSNAGGMSVYAVDQNTGALTKLAFYQIGGQLAFDSGSKWLFESAGNAIINIYRFDPNSGVIAKQGSTTVPVDRNSDDIGSIAVVAAH